ncbi:MAG: TAG lipase/steryl ester hydrolase/phospholipase A2/LPA acyltransferase [Bradymonadia bacterium]|jgi:TAG lipase/steryl ester hydrolase/phospholipase A2/LPA acyltransferase
MSRLSRHGRKEKAKLEKAMSLAESFADWHAAADSLDALVGNDAWVEHDESAYYDAALLRTDIAALAKHVADEDFEALEATLTESLYRNLADVTSPELHARTYTGETKTLVRRYLAAATDAILALATAKRPGLTKAKRQERLQRAARAFGRSALMLSGGATWGLYHLGIVRALHAERLLPEVVCGSSMGAIVAAGIGVRNDEELDALLADVGQIHRSPLRLYGVREMLETRSVMDPAQLVEHIEANSGHGTFAEAHARTGRTLAISVSPTRARQKPRVLSHLTAPDVLISDATVASCAVPGLFPPAKLRSRRGDEEPRPYAPNESWVDGTLQGDLPMSRVGRLHNVNHFIVSQTNPHVLPFLEASRDDRPSGLATELAVSMARAQATAVLDTVRRRVSAERVRPVIDHAHAIAAQQYSGDILIHPQFKPSMYARVLRNVTESQLRDFVRDGERATWPKLAMVRDHTAVTRTLSMLLRASGGRPD